MYMLLLIVNRHMTDSNGLKMTPNPVLKSPGQIDDTMLVMRRHAQYCHICFTWAILRRLQSRRNKSRHEAHEDSAQAQQPCTFSSNWNFQAEKVNLGPQ